MSAITDLQIQKKNSKRVNVYIDGEFSCALELLTVLKLGLKIGQSITHEQLREASLDSERLVAFDKAVDYLARGYKTVHRMREYLTRREYDPDVIEHVIRKLKDYRYLDDDEYAAMYAEQNASVKGSRRIKQELIAKGIAPSVAEEHSGQDCEQALENATRLAEKYMRSRPTDLKTLAGLQRHLVSRGYDFDTVNSVLQRYKLNDDE